MKMKMKVEPELIRKLCSESLTMAEAHRKLGKLKFCTFKKYAKILGVYNPNMGSKGTKKKDV